MIGMDLLSHPPRIYHRLSIKCRLYFVIVGNQPCLTNFHFNGSKSNFTFSLCNLKSLFAMGCLKESYRDFYWVSNYLRTYFVRLLYHYTVNIEVRVGLDLGIISDYQNQICSCMMIIMLMWVNSHFFNFLWINLCQRYTKLVIINYFEFLIRLL